LAVATNGSCDQCAQIKSEFFMLSTSGLHITLLKSPNISTLHCRRAVGRVGSAAGAAVGGVPQRRVHAIMKECEC
jgi:hypothetical protein